jgi:hypothetical protein
MTQVQYLKSLERDVENARTLRARALRRNDQARIPWLNAQVALAERRLEDARERISGYGRVIADLFRHMDAADEATAV